MDTNSILKKYVRKRTKATATRNAKFNALPSAKKRVAIAKDVIKALDAKVFKPRCGFAYVYFDCNSSVSRLRELVDNDQRLFGSIGLDELRAIESCTVCALGSMFIAHSRLGGDVSVKDAILQNYEDKLEGYFELSQLDLIENTFESRCSDDDVKDAGIRAFAREHKSADARLRAIMKNIIDNDGEFILPSAPVSAKGKTP
jgi:hypothetical protein